MWPRIIFHHHSGLLQTFEMVPFPPYLRSFKLCPKEHYQKDSKTLRSVGEEPSWKRHPSPLDLVVKNNSSIFALSFLGSVLNLSTTIAQGSQSPLCECTSPSSAQSSLSPTLNLPQPPLPSVLSPGGEHPNLLVLCFPWILLVISQLLTWLNLHFLSC